MVWYKKYDRELMQGQAIKEMTITRGMMLDKRPPLASGKVPLFPPYMQSCTEELVHQQIRASSSPPPALCCAGKSVGFWQGFLGQHDLFCEIRQGEQKDIVLWWELEEQIFGPRTAAATTLLQKAIGADPDGNCGPETRRKYADRFGIDVDLIPIDFGVVGVQGGTRDFSNWSTQWVGPEMNELYIWPVGTRQ